MKTTNQNLTTMKTNLQIHPSALPVPAMTTEEFADLKKSIKINGFFKQHPIILLDGMILDGRHRYQAALELGIEPEFDEYYGDCPSEFVVAANTRRNLDASQRAVWAANMIPLIQADSDRRRAAGEPVAPGRANERAALAARISTAQVTKAIKLKKTSPEAFQAVAEGKSSLHNATKLDKSAQEKADQENSENIKRIGKICGMSFSQAVIAGTILKTRAEVKRFAKALKVTVNDLFP